jgi:hypothetical protein
MRAATATLQHQPRLGDAPHDIFYARLKHCEACDLRRLHMCRVASQLCSILARPLEGFCPVGTWGTRPVPAAAPATAAATRPVAARRHLPPSVPAPPLGDEVPGPVFAAAGTHSDYSALNHDAPRHLLCHLYPVTAGQKWRRTVAHLAARRTLFTGRAMVAVATDHETDTADQVAAAFAAAGFPVEILPLANDVARGETASFRALLAAIAAESGITFYCHGKGCTWPDSGALSHEWADVMFAACLDYPQLVTRALATAAFAGSFRRHLAAGDRLAPWHYSGTFYWFRNDVVFAGHRGLAPAAGPARADRLPVPRSRARPV